ncbi:MAG TPA: hypothetical protein VK639_16095 [Terriglobales bacterium]|nr:hypothetical protein [Terriglobales bacterium]
MLAKDVLSYLRVRGGRDEFEQQQLRIVCSTLARVLGRLLQGNEKWSVYYWVDDILPISTTVIAGGINVRGLMVWGQSKQAQQWVEPFSGTVRVLETSNRVIYQLMGGDAARGTGKVPYGNRKTRESLDLPEEWLFTFLKE